MSVLKAANRAPVCPAAGVHVGTEAAEAQAARIGTANRTAPILAVGSNIVERTIPVVAVARKRAVCMHSEPVRKLRESRSIASRSVRSSRKHSQTPGSGWESWN